MARRKGETVVCHKHDSLVSVEVHHVWPSGYHGPDTPENRVLICCNAHSDVHHLLERMLRGKPYNLAEYGPQVRAIAQRGYDAVMAYAESLTP